ncbi:MULTISPECIES: hypothetical protein [unclassified Burkholderia]|uniref:hypothetical protein n=1 Tax=unclassified Burkholderia TaxID=2613784 RepID=UPI00211B1E84|nr:MULTISPECIES: hypothetical protein [unclassified Burkholderia]MDN7429853.1 hypothetical protein [Burkholderia sp. AU45388]
MSIFSGERTGRFGAVKFDIFTIFDYLKYTMHARCRQCDRLHNTNDENLESESLVFFIRTVLSKSPFPEFASRANPDTANRSDNHHAAKDRPRPIYRREMPLSAHVASPVDTCAARHSILAARNFHVSNDIIKLQTRTDPRLTNNTNFNYMKIIN